MTSAEYANANLNTRGTHLVDIGGYYAALPNASTALPVSTSTEGSSLAPNFSEHNAAVNPAAYALNNPTTGVNSQIADVAARSAANQAQNGNEATGRIVTTGLDSMDIQFGIRSAKLLQNPYIVTMTRFRTATSKPGTVQNLVYAKSIDPIDQHVSQVHLVEDGFPAGFEVVDFQLHVYNRGVEIASNIADDRVELTRDEAFEYVKMEYIGAHQKETLPPVVVMGHLPHELPPMLAEGKYSDTYFVRVSRDGLADTAYRDPSCKQEVGDMFLNSVVRILRFKPALDQGKPVDGIASVNLSKLQF